MTSPAVNTALMGAAGVTGAGILAWQTKFPWIKYDLQIVKIGSKLVKAAAEAQKMFIVDKFETLAAQYPHRTMVIFEGCHYTYDFMNQQANKVANIFLRWGLKLGDSVALMMQNEPAFMWTVLGLQKLGVAVALINYNLRAKPLAHAILTTDPKALIVGSGGDVQQAAYAIQDQLRGMPVLVRGLHGDLAPSGTQDMDLLMADALPIRPDPSVRSQMTNNTIAIYIYTSGTTGLPKPVYFNQNKLKRFTTTLQLLEATPEDIVYTVLPLYHVAAFGLGFMALLHQGSTLVLKRKFSASQFWSDCCTYNVTIVQYIGELFRYLLAQPKSELDRKHKVRGAIGNGLRKDIFEGVLKRFKITQICEFYAATEGVSLLFNAFNKPGAIGRVSPVLNFLSPYPNVMVKFDYSTAMPIRDKNGRCVKVKPGEIGLFMSQVPDELQTQGNLTVYKASKEANEKKLVRNAFKDGDLYFNYGDVFYLDKDYFVYFHDRIGDTFRWKGENVSTTEVANILSTPDFINDANVYGVTVPGHDGRAGMAALTLNEGEKLAPKQLKEIYSLCQSELPSYARPLFLRILPEAVLTGTFKQRKVELVEQGYDTSKVKDELYFLDSKALTYSPLTSEGLVSFLQSKL